MDFVFSEASTARAALYTAYEKWRGNAGVHSNGAVSYTHLDVYKRQVKRQFLNDFYRYRAQK